VVHGFVSMLIGFLGGIISCVGFKYITPIFNDKEGPLHDTCGVLNLHGIPGILGGMIGAISAGVAG
jgi:ammonium transporter Rh